MGKCKICNKVYKDSYMQDGFCQDCITPTVLEELNNYLNEDSSKNKENNTYEEYNILGKSKYKIFGLFLVLFIILATFIILAISFEYTKPTYVCKNMAKR